MAFKRGDREAIRDGHTKDWCGFQINSMRPVKGIDQYMEAVDRVLKDIGTQSYEMIDFDVTFVGDVALVCYLAREVYLDAAGKEQTMLLRSIDVYRPDGGHWNQCASNIIALPDREV